MEDGNTIQLSLQLPPGTLDGLARLVEQLRYLAVAVSGGEAPETFLETGEDPSFDRKLSQEPDREGGTAPGSGPTPPIAAAVEVRPDLQGTADASAVERSAFPSLETPAAAGSPISERPEDPRGPQRRIAQDREDAPDAPLTPRALSKTLRRDIRRYDGGFPLY